MSIIGVNIFLSSDTLYTTEICPLDSSSDDDSVFDEEPSRSSHSRRSSHPSDDSSTGGSPAQVTGGVSVYPPGSGRGGQPQRQSHYVNVNIPTNSPGSALANVLQSSQCE